MKLTLPDGDTLEVEEGTRVIDVAYDIGPGLGDATVGATLDGKLLDLRDEITEEGEFEIITLDSPQANEIIRHTASHVMAQAVKRLYDDVQLAIGPAIDDGFYYDFDLPDTISEDDFDDIKSEMQEIVDEGYEIERFTKDAEAAEKYLEDKGEDYKLELLEEFVSEGVEEVSFYRQDGFTDLCEGPHLQDTSQLKHFELMDVAGAYWRGDEDNVMLQRVYGTAFSSESDLNEYVERRRKRQRSGITGSSDRNWISSLFTRKSARDWLTGTRKARPCSIRSRTSGVRSTGSPDTSSSRRPISGRATSGRRAATWITSARICSRRCGKVTRNISSNR